MKKLNISLILAVALCVISNTSLTLCNSNNPNSNTETTPAVTSDSVNTSAEPSVTLHKTWWQVIRGSAQSQPGLYPLPNALGELLSRLCNDLK